MSNPGKDSRSCNATSDETHDEAGVQAPNQTCDLPKDHGDGPVHQDYRTGFFTKNS